jgi:hypothetical protein
MTEEINFENLDKLLNIIFIEGFGSYHHKYLVETDEMTLTYLSSLSETYLQTRQATQMQKTSIYHFLSFIDLSQYDPSIRQEKTDFSNDIHKIWTFMIVKWIHFFWNKHESILPYLSRTLQFSDMFFSKDHIMAAIKISEEKFPGIPKSFLKSQWKNLQEQISAEHSKLSEEIGHLIDTIEHGGNQVGA